ncbi:MAG: GNAT family N-acetyltransferase, partial [Candidatus Omnitrophica bacterium]|nr:GNAT family N-acetyltransferase [Candidatus Omnitrophota bacterium]
SSGQVFVVDALNDNVTVTDSNGNFITMWGGYGFGPGRFTYPDSITTTTNGQVIVGDTGGNCIQIFSTSLIANGTVPLQSRPKRRRKNQPRTPADTTPAAGKELQSLPGRQAGGFRIPKLVGGMGILSVVAIVVSLGIHFWPQVWALSASVELAGLGYLMGAYMPIAIKESVYTSRLFSELDEEEKGRDLWQLIDNYWPVQNYVHWDGREANALIAYINGKPVGALAFLKFSADVVQDNGIFVIESARKNHIGTFLWEELLRYLKKENYKVFQVGGEKPNCISKALEVQLFLEKALNGRRGVVILRDEAGKIKSVTINLVGEDEKTSGQLTSNPYRLESYVNRGLSELDSVYRLSEELKAHNGMQQVLLIGVGRGYAAIELALKFPNLRITAVNKEEGLWDDVKIKKSMRNKGYSKEDIRMAKGRISLKVLDIEDETVRNNILGNKLFDFVVFETRTQIYLRDKVKVIQGLFNERLKTGGIYSFVIDNFYLSGNAVGDIRSIIRKAFERSATLKNEDSFGAGLYVFMTYEKTGEFVDIPLKLDRVFSDDFGGAPIIHSYYNKREAPAVSPVADAQKNINIPRKVSLSSFEDLLGDGEFKNADFTLKK